MTKLTWITNIITEWIASKKTGSLQINFFKGSISNINQIESLKYEDDIMK